MPDANLLRAVRRGEIGGVILFPRNAPTPAAVRSLTQKLRAAARAGRSPRPLVVVDQEGGSVKRLAWAPPDRPPPALGAAGDAATRAEGRRTGRVLRSVGVDVDLAPLADVPDSPAAIVAREGRAYGYDARTVGDRAAAFTRGLRDAGIRGALKHFPGLGLARENTDRAPQTIAGTPAQRAAELASFRHALRAGGAPLVMLSWASYPALGADEPAGRSRAVVDRLLRRRLGYRGVTLTDSLAARAVKANTTPPRMAVAAARAGVDLLLWGGTGYSWHAPRDLLEAAARAGALSRGELERSYARIVALKRAI